MGIGAVVVLVLVALGCAVLVSAWGDHGSALEVARTGAASAAPGEGGGAGSSGAQFFVHILGAVERPGLYGVREGDRVIDAVAAAGGFTDSADQTQVNLARFLVDGEQLYVPTVGETPASAPGAAALLAPAAASSFAAGALAAAPLASSSSSSSSSSSALAEAPERRASAALSQSGRSKA